MSEELHEGLAAALEGAEANLAASETVISVTRECAERALATLIRSGHAFTSNTVHSVMLTEGCEDYDRRVVASVMLLSARKGDIEEVYGQPRARALHRAAHGRVVRWWRGASSDAEAA